MSKEKQLIKPKGLAAVLHFLGFHHWVNIYYKFKSVYGINHPGIAYRQYCCHCNQERDNKVVIRDRA